MLSTYLDGYLEAGDTVWVEGHLAACPRCRQELASLKATIALLHGLPQVQPRRSFLVPPRPVPAPVPAWGWRMLRASTVAAGLLLLALVAGDMLNLVAVGPAARLEAPAALGQLGRKGPAGPPLPTPMPRPAGAEATFSVGEAIDAQAAERAAAPPPPATAAPLRIPLPWPGWQLEAGLAGAWLILGSFTLYRWHARRREG